MSPSPAPPCPGAQSRVIPQVSPWHSWPKGPAQLKPGRGPRKPELRALTQGGPQLPQTFPRLPNPQVTQTWTSSLCLAWGRTGPSPAPAGASEAAGRVQVSWNTRSFSPSWPPRVHSRLSCFAQAFPSPGVHHIPLRIATSPSKPVVPILGCIGNHLGHLLKNPNALVAHRTNSIRMSGARNQASAFEKNPK